MDEYKTITLSEVFFDACSGVAFASMQEEKSLSHEEIKLVAKYAGYLKAIIFKGMVEE